MLLKLETIVGSFVLAACALFVYLSFQLGSFRIELARYATYTMCFKDVAGLAQKADVKIAGVKIGWVDRIKLLPEETTVELTLKVLKEYSLYNNATAVIRQEGMLGVKFLELNPGDPASGKVPPGGSLPFQSRQFVGMDEIFYSFQQIYKQVEMLGTSLRGATDEAQKLLVELKERLKPLDTFLSKLSQGTELSIEQFQKTAQAIRDVAEKIGVSVEEARVPVKQIGEFAKTVQEGKGSLGKILNDSTLYEDIKCTTNYAKHCVERVRRCAVAVDSHLEILPRACDEGTKTNVKWYFGGQFYPCPQLFGILGLVYSHEGFAKRIEELCDTHCFERIRERRDALRLELQIGGCLGCGLGARAGLFDGTAGVALDYHLPFGQCQWISSFEAFDFKGHNRFGCDDRPFLKWINRLFFGPSLYLVFGANDFISRCNRSGFVGLGAYFSTSHIWK